MISYIENKALNWDLVHSYLSESSLSNHWANFGPVSVMLEKELENTLTLDAGLSVIACTSGTLALFALADLHEHLLQRPLKWAVSSYTFACCRLGPFKDAVVVDCDASGLLDLSKVPSSVDGIVVTNLFGSTPDLRTYQEWCQARNKVYIADAATALESRHHANEIVSFHHTKPWGFGEGGIAIVKKEHEKLMRSIINFGFTVPIESYLGTNGKISDIAAAFILQRLSRLSEISDAYKRQYYRIAKIAMSQGYSVFGECWCTPGNVPLLAPKAVSNLDNDIVKLHKYYKPLSPTPVATLIYDRIVNYPCQPGVAALSDADIARSMELF